MPPKDRNPQALQEIGTDESKWLTLGDSRSSSTTTVRVYTPFIPPRFFKFDTILLLQYRSSLIRLLKYVFIFEILDLKYIDGTVEREN